jgi:hypothetical protein
MPSLAIDGALDQSRVRLGGKDSRRRIGTSTGVESTRGVLKERGRVPKRQRLGRRRTARSPARVPNFPELSGSLHAANVQGQPRCGLPTKSHGSPWAEARSRAAASSVRLDLDGKWNGLPDVASRYTNLTCVVRNGSIVSRDSLVTRFTNSTCSFSTSAHFNCTAATLGNATGLNRASRRFIKSLKNA